jgi:hypothetical protein
VACEIFVMDNEGGMDRVDYVILYGNTKTTWDDAFPRDEEAVKVAEESILELKETSEHSKGTEPSTE